MNPKSKILVIEDEVALLEAYISYLNLEGFIADGLSSLSAAQNWLLTHDFDILILDLNLGDGNGLEWLTHNNQLLNKGLIIITARDSLADQYAGIKAGADAYLTKPVPLEIISATAHNLSKRIKPHTPYWSMNTKQWLLTSPDNQSVKLTHSEVLLVECIANTPRKIISRDQFIFSLGHSADYYDVRRLEIMIRRLRRKVLKNFGFDLPLETVHSKGFSFTAPIQLID